MGTECFSYMDRKSLFSFMIKQSEIIIRAVGHSMYPEICEGDRITIVRADCYFPGDVVVFIYKQGLILVHRIIRISDRYYCKGDNALRIEDIDINQIYGKVTKKNGQRLLPWPSWKIELSERIGRLFVEYRYDINKTLESEEYKQYMSYLREESIDNTLNTNG